MKTKIILISFFIISIILFSCKKEETSINPIPDRPTSMSELTATSDFGWQTVNNVKVKIQGSHIMTTSIMTANGNVYFKGLVKPNAKIETTIALPSTINEILVTYGPFTKIVKITNNTIDCNFDLNKF
jgi:hypothetical protein